MRAGSSLVWSVRAGVSRGVVVADVNSDIWGSDALLPL